MQIAVMYKVIYIYIYTYRERETFVLEFPCTNPTYSNALGVNHLSLC